MTYNRPILPLTGAISRADVQRQTDDFTVALDNADIASIAATLGASAAGLNYLQNSDFRAWPQTSISVPASWTQTAADWYALGVYSPSASTGITVARSEDTAHNYVIYCASITGEPNGTECKFGQRITAAVAAAFLQESATLTIELENKTGATLTPELVFESCNVRDDFSATTATTSWTLSAVANNARVTLTKTIDLSAFIAATRRGGLFYVRLQGLNSGAKEWRVYYSRLEPGSIATPRRIDRATPASASATGADPANYFGNPAFVRWQLGAAFAIAIEDADNYFCERWGVTPSDGGTTCAVTRVLSAPDTRSQYALQVTGNAAATGTCDIHQFVPSAAAAHLRADVLNVSWWVFNNTGASLTPTLIIETCNTANSVARTNRLTQAMQPCSAGAWTRVTLSFTPGALTNWQNGARLALRFGALTLDSGAKSVRVAQAQLVRGTAAATFWSPSPESAIPVASTARTASALAITRPTSTTVLVTCAQCVCQHPDGAAVIADNISTTLTNAGLTNNQWYLIRVAADESGQGTAYLDYETAPGTFLPPTGSLWISGVIGAVYYTGGAFSEFNQRGNFVVTLPTFIAVTTAAANTYQQVQIVAGLETSCPALAIGLRGSFGAVVTAVPSRTALAASASGLGAVDFVAGANSTTGLDGFVGGAAPFHLPLGASRAVWIKTAVITIACQVATTGFDLP